LTTQIASNEPLITSKVLPQLEALLQKLKDKISFNDWDYVPGSSTFSINKTLSCGHLLPITNVSIDKYGDT